MGALLLDHQPRAQWRCPQPAGEALLANLRALLHIPTDGRGCSSGVEHHVANVRVEGSNPFARSNFQMSSPDAAPTSGTAVAVRPTIAAQAPCRGLGRARRLDPAPSSLCAKGQKFMLGIDHRASKGKDPSLAGCTAETRLWRRPTRAVRPKDKACVTGGPILPGEPGHCVAACKMSVRSRIFAHGLRCPRRAAVGCGGEPSVATMPLAATGNRDRDRDRDRDR